MTSEKRAPEDPVPGNVKRLREHRDMSQADLADKMTDHGHRWFQNTVYRVEAGKQEISLREALSLAAILRADLADLTRPGPEAAEAEKIRWAAQSLHRNWANSATALDGLLTAREEAEKAVRAAQRSDYPSVRKAGAALAEDLARMTVESVTGGGHAEAEAAG